MLTESGVSNVLCKNAAEPIYNQDLRYTLFDQKMVQNPLLHWRAFKLFSSLLGVFVVVFILIYFELKLILAMENARANLLNLKTHDAILFILFGGGGISLGI